MQTEQYCNLVRHDRMTNFFESALQLKFEDTDNTSIFIHACESWTLMAGLEKRTRALLFWFFGGFRCGIPLFIVMLVIY